MNEKLETLQRRVISASEQSNFKHRQWFVTWHLEIVAQISKELLAAYPEANAEVTLAAAWLHDYGKAFGKDTAFTLSAGREELEKCGFDTPFIENVVKTIGYVDAHTEMDISKAPIEAQIVSSADGCAHLVGPFMRLFWHENPDWTIEDLMKENQRKLNHDWKLKVCLPEAKKAFESRLQLQLEEAGKLPEAFL